MGSGRGAGTGSSVELSFCSAPRLATAVVHGSYAETYARQGGLELSSFLAPCSVLHRTHQLGSSSALNCMAATTSGSQAFIPRSDTAATRRTPASQSDCIAPSRAATISGWHCQL